jgi:hypothetical protein
MTSNYVIKFTSIRQRGLLEFYDEASDMIMKRCELARIIAHNQKEDTDVKDEDKHVISFKLDFDFTTILLFINIVSYSVKYITKDDYSKSGDLIKIMCYMGFDRDMCDYIQQSYDNDDITIVSTGHLWDEDGHGYNRGYFPGVEDRLESPDFKSFDDFLASPQCVRKLDVLCKDDDCKCNGGDMNCCTCTWWEWDKEHDVLLFWDSDESRKYSVTIKVSKSDEEVVRKYIVDNRLVL